MKGVPKTGPGCTSCSAGCWGSGICPGRGIYFLWRTQRSRPDYLTNDNDQAVVEICITRITTAIRETGSIERHSEALVGLWESCLEHNLTPQGENTEDTPHAKIASDITSCILQNYSCPSVMVLAVPVAVRFLQRGNRELSRNMSSNHMLLRVLPSVYPRQPDTIHGHLGNLTAMMSQLESPEQQHLIRLIQIMLSPQVPALVSFLGDQSLTECLLGALVDVSQASPSSLVSFLPTLRNLGQQCPALLGHVAKIHVSVCVFYRVDEMSPFASLAGGGRGSEQRLQLKIQAFEDKMGRRWERRRRRTLPPRSDATA
ncbi:hypothetical protein F7725_021036 [Dissostichus mawsoni]|uniref:Uncharacterized protein n=1 Tax=Dissostichus mawsoni TaxID=36200 RepID=A0A7J5YIA4_DISMA|nr:hypothetical protein F7725_021036 [Dissostichus mawsoni]